MADQLSPRSIGDFVPSWRQIGRILLWFFAIIGMLDVGLGFLRGFIIGYLTSIALP